MCSLLDKVNLHLTINRSWIVTSYSINKKLAFSSGSQTCFGDSENLQIQEGDEVLFVVWCLLTGTQSTYPLDIAKSDLVGCDDFETFFTYTALDHQYLLSCTFFASKPERIFSAYRLFMFVTR